MDILGSEHIREEFMGRGYVYTNRVEYNASNGTVAYESYPVEIRECIWCNKKFWCGTHKKINDTCGNCSTWNNSYF